MSETVLLALHEALCGVLLWTCFCRATRTNSGTALQILAAFYLLSISAIFATIAPLIIGWVPDSVSLTLLGSIALVQTVTARFWQRTPPGAFQRPPQDPSCSSPSTSPSTN